MTIDQAAENPQPIVVGVPSEFTTGDVLDSVDSLAGKYTVSESDRAKRIISRVGELTVEDQTSYWDAHRIDTPIGSLVELTEADLPPIVGIQQAAA